MSEKNFLWRWTAMLSAKPAPPVAEVIPANDPSLLPGATSANASIVEGPKPQLEDETVELLRGRLRVLSLLLAALFFIFFDRNLLVGNYQLIEFRAGVLIGITLIWALLLSKLSLALNQLRWVEFALFGLVGLDQIIMFSVHLSAYVEKGDAVSATTACNQVYAMWSLLILSYGMLIPNRWWRAALVLLPSALVPMIQMAILRRQVTGLDAIVNANQFPFNFHLTPILCSLAGIYVTHVIDSVRRQAFNAKQFGQYVLKERIGEGGMGEVYKAEHLLLKRPCAIKLIKKTDHKDANVLARFEREVQTTARLTHWNTVEIFDYGHTGDGTFYYVMELLEGANLRELIEKHGPMPPGRVVYLLEQVCRALREAHEIGLIHRDLKPANIFAARIGGGHDVAKLLDFGLVKQRRTESDDDDDLTEEGITAGTPLYMAPEQATAFKDVDARSDIYALGAVAYHLLTGRPPFERAGKMEIIIAHARDPVVLPTTLNAAIATDLEQVVLRCLEKKPEDRFQDADSLRIALNESNCAIDWNEKKATAWWQTCFHK